MKASELIALTQKLIDKHGDLECKSLEIVDCFDYRLEPIVKVIVNLEGNFFEFTTEW